AAYNSGNAGKPDFNSATPTSLARYLTQKDPLALSATAGDKYQQLAKQILDYRDKTMNGLVSNFDDLAKVPGATAPVVASIKDGFAVGPFAVRNAEIVGAKVGAELRRQAVFVTLYALAGMLVYIAFRFEW